MLVRPFAKDACKCFGALLMRHILKTRANRGCGGFTLIELLAVIAVVGILAAILIPLLAGVRERALTARGVSNIRQSGNALLLSATNNDNKIILVGGEHPSYTTWLSELERQGFADQSVREAAVCPTHPPFEFSGNYAAVYGVPMNEQLGPALTSPPGGGQTRALRLASIEDPANYVLLVDSVLNGTGPQWRTAWDAGNVSGAHARHDGKMNVVFADGSAATITPEKYASIRRDALGDPAAAVTYFTEEGERLEVE